MKNFYFKTFLLACLFFSAGTLFAQFSMKDNTNIGQKLLVDLKKGIETFVVDFNTAKDSSYWKWTDETQTAFTITLSKCQTQRGLQVNVYESEAAGAAKIINGDFECRDYGANRNPVRVKSVASLSEILGKFEIKNAGTADSVKNVRWKPSACLFDLDTLGVNQAFGAHPGMYKVVEYGFQYNFAGVSVTDVDISFEIDTYDPGNTGKTATYNLIVATGSATNIIGQVDNFYVSGSGNKTVKLAEAIGKTPALFSNQKVYFFLKTLGTGTAIAKGTVDPVIILDNFTVTYTKPAWIDPAAGTVANAVLDNAAHPVGGQINQEGLFGLHLQTSGRLGTLTITNDRAFYATRLFTFLPAGAVKARDSQGNYTVDVPYTFTEGSETVKDKIVIAAPEGGKTNDDLMLFVKAKPVSFNPVFDKLELDCGTRIWFNFYIRGGARVGYFTKEKTMDVTAVSVSSDPVLKILQTDPNLKVTLNVMTDVSETAPADISNYDVVVIQESFDGADKILSPAGPLALKKLNVPTLYNEAFAFRKGRALTEGGSATGDETHAIYKIKVDSLNLSSDLFKGITFTKNEAQLFIEGTDDKGYIGGIYAKALNYVTGLEISAPNTLLAVPAGLTDDVPTLSFSDIPAGTTVGGELIPARMITVGMNFGAICASKGKNITAEGLTIWRNAVYELAGLEGPLTKVNISSAPDTLYASVGKLSPAFDGSKKEYTLNLPSGTTTVSLMAVPAVPGARVNLPESVALSDGQDKRVQVVSFNVLGNDSTVYTVDIHVATAGEILFVGGSNEVPLASASALKQDKKTVAMLKNAGYSVTYVYKWGVTKTFIGEDFDFTPFKAVVFGASAPSDGTKSYAQAGYPIPCVNLQKDGPRYNKWGWIANQAAQYTEKKITALAAADRVNGLKMKVTSNQHYITAPFAANRELVWCSATADSADFTKIVFPEFNLTDSIPEAIPLAKYVGGTNGLFNLWAIPRGGKVKSLYPDNTYADAEIKNRIVLLAVQSDAMLYPTATFDTLLIRALEWVMAIPTAVNQMDLPGEIMVYPNPAKDYVKARINLSEPGYANFTMFNLTGQKVLTGTKQLLYGGVSEIVINTADLKEGVYIFRLETSEKIGTVKLVITK